VAKETFKELANILTNRKVMLNTRKRILNSYVWSILLNVSEAWAISNILEEKLTLLGLWLFRHLLGVSW